MHIRSKLHPPLSGSRTIQLPNAQGQANNRAYLAEDDVPDGGDKMHRGRIIVLFQRARLVGQHDGCMLRLGTNARLGVAESNAKSIRGGRDRQMALMAASGRDEGSHSGSLTRHHV